MSNTLEPITERDFHEPEVLDYFDEALAKLDKLHGKPKEIDQEVKEIFGYKKDSNVIYSFN